MNKNYTPDSISFFEGFLGPRGDVGFHMVYDEKKAKKIINKLLKEKKEITCAKVGLDGDWNENHDILYDGKNFKNTDFYKSSIWAEPIMIVYFENLTSEKYDVWERKNK